MLAHARVCSGPERVTDGHLFGVYTPVYCFILLKAQGHANSSAQ